MTTYRIWPATDGPANAVGNGDSDVTLGVEFYVTDDADATHVHIFCGATFSDMDGHIGLIYRVDSESAGTELARKTFSALTVGQWNTVELDDPVTLTPNQRYRAAVWCPNGYTATSGNNYWQGGGAGAAGHTNGILVAPNRDNATGNDQGSFVGGGIPAFPTNSFNAGNYWIDVTVDDGGAGTTATAGHASGTGAANAATVAVTATAGTASGTGTAHSATGSVTASAGHASGTGAAHAPTVITAGSEATATAGHASGTGTAYDATVTVVSASTGGSWGPLLALVRESRTYRPTPRPVACPDDGEPLQLVRGTCHCRFCGRGW